MSNTPNALQYVVSLLARRDYSEYELKQKLKQKAYAEEEAGLAISQAQQRNWQSDERFCHHFIRYRAEQGYGPNRLRLELRQRGIAESLIAEAIAAAEVDWFALAERVLMKKRPAVWDIKAKQKIWRYMLNHGFKSEHFEHLIGVDVDEQGDYWE